jgi:histidine phosphotransferase ChpT
MADASTVFPADLVALVGSRLCHDLISPLGAIGNGVELLMLSDLSVSPELQLVAESVGNATARLKFFRLAFGQAGAEQRMGRTEIVALLADLARGNRLRFDWQVEGDQPRQEVKLAFLALLCLEAALPWGGVIAVGKSGEAWNLSASAGRVKPDPALWAQLDGIDGSVTPAQVQFALLPLEAARQDRRPGWEITGTGVRLTF